MGTRTVSVVLLPGAGSDSWYWHLVVPRLEAVGHRVVTVDLPWDDRDAGLYEYADVVVGAVQDLPRPLVLVSQSMSAFTAVAVAEFVPVDLLVMVAPMIPSPGESPGEWWTNTRHAEERRTADVAAGRDPDAPLDPREVFFHDVPAALADEAFARGESDPAESAFATAWRAETWPDVPVRVLAGRHDRLFPFEFVTRLARERLMVEPDAIDSGHLLALARPDAVADHLDRYARSVQ
ncbi:alpha/beta fold hydrolase [Rhodococcus sp. HNM0569]|uniref:alpha/beta fold hydrolase n=1 Tax=Rhodococcus sp. HNM0569 TaxID=2716340 RepID=UPI00146AF99D|nr:alpha/beta fold hydrolase [Rhodococcus sp. HNM0569]NLU84360.1 alpha/beta hydrolase [Rhodococcus sp. HNM0569]